MTADISTLAPIFELACMGRAAVDLYGEQVGCRLEDVSIRELRDICEKVER